MTREQKLRWRVRMATWVLIAGLIVSGASAIPLTAEVHWLAGAVGAGRESSEIAAWLLRVDAALTETQAKHPFLFYGTDWLAFGHFVIAVAFVGALRDPVRNRWLFDFGLIACVMVVPYAWFFGELRGIPRWWRLVDCAFGIGGFIPLWLCRRWARELERASGDVLA